MATTAIHPSRRATLPTRRPIVLSPRGNDRLHIENAVWDAGRVFKTIMDALASVGFAGAIQWWTATDITMTGSADTHHLSIYDLSHPDKAVQFIDAVLETMRNRESLWEFDFRQSYGQPVALAIVEGAHLVDRDFHTPEGYAKRGWTLHLPNVQVAGTEVRNSVPRNVDQYINPTADSEQVG